MSGQQARILIVDDDADTRDVYIQFLSEAGFVVDEAENGREGLERISEAMPDLIISAVIMPIMDGFAFVQALKGNPETARIPIIFLSHLGRQDHESRSKELGVDDFIVRDITPLKEVMARIRVLLSSTEYILAIEPGLFDANRLASDLGLPENYASSDGVNGRYVFRIRLVDASKRRFGGEIISA
jgi:DNA-binding response OmpR family regulator